VRRGASPRARLAAAMAAMAVGAAAMAGPDEPSPGAPNLAVTTPPAAVVTVDRAVIDGVEFLVAHQNEDGSFGRSTSGRTYEILADVPGSHEAFKAATTALCWMGLRDATHQTPESEAAAARALGWLVPHIRVKRANQVELYNVWSHGYGLQAMVQALATDAPGADPGEIRAAAESLIAALEIYQVPDGGWGYYDFNAHTYHPSGTSMSFTTATILVALHAAREVGLEVPQPMIDKAVKCLRICRKKDGSYIYGWYLRYRPLMGVNQPKGSSMRTPACNLALRLFDAGITDDDLRRGLEQLVKYHRFAIAGVRRRIPHESWYQVSGYFYLYGHQYAALCLQLMSSEDQQTYWPAVVRGTLKTRQPDGSFWDYPMYGYHKFYGTGYALMTLSRCPEAIASSIAPLPGAE
jgi:hypothetical protein